MTLTLARPYPMNGMLWWAVLRANAPKPKVTDNTAPLSPNHLSSTHNSFWNWFGAVSWTAEPVASRANGRVCRGYHGPTYFYVNTVDHRHEDIGWRPLLEEVL